MRETPAHPCEWCGYDLTGLPVGHACPECGEHSADPTHQVRAEAWFASSRGCFFIDPPRGVLARLGSPHCRAIALSRYLRWVILPSLLMLAGVAIRANVSVVNVYERWWESTGEPGRSHDVDCIHGCRLNWFGEGEENRVPLVRAARALQDDRTWHISHVRTDVALQAAPLSPPAFLHATVLLPFLLMFRIGAVYAVAACCLRSSPRRSLVTRLKLAWAALSSSGMAYSMTLSFFLIVSTAAEFGGRVPPFHGRIGPEIGTVATLATLAFHALLTARLAYRIGASAGPYEARNMLGAETVASWFVATCVLSLFLVLVLFVVVATCS